MVVVVFLVVDFAGVLLPVLVDVDLLTVLAGVLVVVRGVVLLVVRDDVLAGVAAPLLADVDGVAIASIRGAGFFGIVALTALTASVCCSKFMRNSWCPSRVATK